MNYFNSDDTPVENTPVENQAADKLKDTLLEAAANLDTEGSVDITVPSGIPEGEWVAVFNDCYNKKGDFADLGPEIVVDKHENDGVVITLTDQTAKLAEIAARQASINPKPPNSAALSDWPAGPASPLPEEDPDDA